MSPVDSWQTVALAFLAVILGFHISGHFHR